jgi:hypothetical protein
MFELQRQLLLVSLMVSHHRTYPPHDRPLCITPRNILSLWSLYQFLLVLSRFFRFAGKWSARGVASSLEESLRREKDARDGRGCGHPLVSPQASDVGRGEFSWLLHMAARHAVGLNIRLGDQTPRRLRGPAARRRATWQLGDQQPR